MAGDVGAGGRLGERLLVRPRRDEQVAVQPHDVPAGQVGAGRFERGHQALERRPWHQVVAVDEGQVAAARLPYARVAGPPDAEVGLPDEADAPVRRRPGGRDGGAVVAAAVVHADHLEVPEPLRRQRVQAGTEVLTTL